MTTPLLHSLPAVANMLSIGRSSMYTLIADGKIRTVKLGRRTLITDQEVLRFVKELEAQTSEL